MILLMQSKVLLYLLFTCRRTFTKDFEIHRNIHSTKTPNKLFSSHELLLIITASMIATSFIIFLASKLYGVNATIIVFVFALYCSKVQ